MKVQMPRTPLSTPLSGSAKETEIRLKNIFSGPKKRPPALFLALMFSVCVFCGNLVSCQNRPAEEPEDEHSVQLDHPGLADDSARWTLYWEDAAQTLFEQREDYFPEYGGGECLLNVTGEEVNLLLCAWSPGAHAGGFRNLLLGSFDQEGGLVDFYEIPGDAGLWSSWEEADGLHLLCTNTVTWQGDESGGPPMHFRFDGKTLAAIDEVPVSSMSAPAMPQRLSEWGTEHKFLPLPGAVEVYKRAEGWMSFQPEWQGVPQWEYQGTVPLSTAQVDPVPAVARDIARSYIDQSDWEGVPNAGTPILRLEQVVEWTNFTGCSLCPEWQGKEDLTLVAWDLEFGDPGDSYYMHGQTHLLFLKEGKELTFLTTFYDGSPLDVSPEPEYLAALSPYNWYASVALTEAGYLTALPRMANAITRTPVPQAAWRLASGWCENHPEEGLTVERLEPVAVVTTQPGWVAVYRMNGEYLAFFEISDFRMFDSCLTVRPENGVSSLEKAALSAYWGLLDSEVALWDLSQMPHYASAVGPGANRDFFLTVQDEGMADGGGVWTGMGRLFEARFRTVPGSEGRWGWRFTEYLDTTRRLPTIRGTVIGDSLDKVRADYPELRDDLVTGAWVYRGERDAVMEFYFEDNILSRIILREGNE